MIQKFFLLSFLFFLFPFAHADDPSEGLRERCDEEVLSEEWDANAQYKAAFMRTAAIILGLIILLIVVIWLLRRMSGIRPLSSNQHKNIKVLERRALSPQTVLYQVEIAGKQVIISESKANVTTITEVHLAK